MTIATRNDLSIYDEVAPKWWTDDIRWVRTLQNMVPGRFAWFDRHIDWEDKTVLDLGCAGGFMSEALAKRGANVTGIDPARDAIEEAGRHAQLNNLKIRYDAGVGEALPYDGDSFDCVVCVDVLEHVADLGQVLAEVTRVLKPGGLFLYDTINRNPLSKFLAITCAENMLGLLPKGTHDPELFIKPDELSAMLDYLGFKVGPTTGLGPVGINRKGDFIFGPLPFRAVIYMGIARTPVGAFH